MISKKIKLASLLLVLSVAPTFVMAQRSVNIDEAVALALKNRPMIKSAETAVKRAEVERGEAWEISPTSFKYNWDKYNNTPSTGNEFGVSQSFGSLITPFFKYAQIKQKTISNEMYVELVKREVTSEVKQSWYNAEYFYNIVLIYKDYYDVSFKIQELVSKKHELGEATVLEKRIAISSMALISNMLFGAENDYLDAVANLNRVCFSEEDIIPIKIKLEKMVLSEKSKIQLSQIYMNYYENRLLEKDKAIKVEKSRYFPELTAGYSRKDMDIQNSYNSWSVGLAIPIFFAPQKSKVRQAELDKIMAEYDTEDILRNLEYNLEKILLKLDGYDNRVRLFEEVTLVETEYLKEAIDVQLKLKEIDLNTFMESMKNIIDVERSYYEAILNYNLTLAECEMYI